MTSGSTGPLSDTTTGTSRAGSDPFSEPTAIAALLDAAVAAIGGHSREGQVKMAREVMDAIEQQRHLLVQAGTGTGKSLAYLVPALLHAVLSDTTVVVSTATVALQAQIVDRDLPRIVDAIAPMLPRRPTYSLLKGRANYVCLHKLEGGYPEDEPEGTLFQVRAPQSESENLGQQVVRLREWAQRTETGDRDHLDEGVADRAWRQVSVSATACLGQKCPLKDECFSEAARNRVHEVDLVITNHAVLAIDIYGDRTLLPDHDVVVVDEAHELQARVTSAVTRDISGMAGRSACTQVRRAGVTPADLESATDGLDAVLRGEALGRVEGEISEELSGALDVMLSAANSLAAELGTLTPSPDQAGAVQTAKSAASALADTCERILGGDPNDVVWVSSWSDDDTRRTLHVAPMSVALAVRDGLFSRRTTVLTSATLTLGGAFDAVAMSVGLQGAGRVEPGVARRAQDPALAWSAVDVGSPFDYPKQGILYVARSVPAPGRDGTDAAMLVELQRLMESAGGGTLGLFSSMRGARAAAEYMRANTDFTVLCQGEDGLNALVRAFTEDPHACLFGTLSLWQGIDVPGLSCRLVVIDRIPFPRPDDPIISARSQAVSESGGNAFMRVSAPHAALLMAQGAGRLIRSHADRGVVAVLDSRLATKQYGAFFKRSLPPLWYTESSDIVQGSLQRLAALADAPTES
ncbi:ATP-dependent DNA helicase [Micrococcales bacterium 31B]|nr:ATP-dependent DNA helicase [Micrococcales bacterium 31B]